MAATIINITKIGASDTNVKIKVNDGHPVPSAIMTDLIQSFRTWIRDGDHIFIWTNDQNQEVSMTVPCTSIGWVLSSMSINDVGDRDRFRIDYPCEIVIVPE